jgi:hypothetical protein
MEQLLQSETSLQSESSLQSDPSLPTEPSPHADPSLEQVTDRLRHARLRAGFSQRFAAADKFGWSYPDYVAHERGQADVPLQSAKQYAKGFGVSVEWLLYGIGEMDRREQRPRDPTVEELRQEVERLNNENAALLMLLKGGKSSLA